MIKAFSVVESKWNATGSVEASTSIQISAARISTGEAVVITTRYRPVEGARGFYRTNFRHGVSPIYGGERYTLGIIFHDSV